MERAEIAEAAAEELPGLLRYARTLVRDTADAEDLVQDTLARALERAQAFRGESSLTTWLHRIMHNLAVDLARRRREVPSDAVAEEVEARWREDAYTVDAATVAARSEDREELLEALAHLPTHYRAAVVLHDAEQMTVRQVAEIQDIGLPAAKQRLRRGRMMLVSELARGHERRAALKGVPLRCWEARSRVSDYLDGELADDDAARVQHHLEGCPTCPPLYSALVVSTSALAASLPRDPDSVVPPSLAGRIAALQVTAGLDDPEP